MKVYWCEGVLCEGVPVGLEGYMDMSCTGGGERCHGNIPRS